MSRDTTVIAFGQPGAIDDPLSELAREGARRILAQVLIAEADSFVAPRFRSGEICSNLKDSSAEPVPGTMSTTIFPVSR